MAAPSRVVNVNFSINVPEHDGTLDASPRPVDQGLMGAPTMTYAAAPEAAHHTACSPAPMTQEVHHAGVSLPTTRPRFGAASDRAGYGGGGPLPATHPDVQAMMMEARLRQAQAETVHQVPPPDHAVVAHQLMLAQKEILLLKGELKDSLRRQRLALLELPKIRG